MTKMKKYGNFKKCLKTQKSEVNKNQVFSKKIMSR